MIDLCVIEQAARKPSYCRSKQEDDLLSPEVLVELITRLRQAEKDATRYLWLRDKAVDQYLHVITTLESLEWDSFIDGAMKCER